MRQYKFLNETNPYQLVIYSLVRAFKPKLCLEIGTGKGSTTAMIARALKESGGGRIITIENDKQLCKYSRSVWEAYPDLDNIELIEGSSPKDLPLRPFDFVFFDQTYKDKYIFELEHLLKTLADDCLCVAHDTNRGHGGGNALQPFLKEKGIPYTDLEPYDSEKFVGMTVFRVRKELK